MFCHKFANMPKFLSYTYSMSYTSSTLRLRLFSYIKSLLCVQQKQFKQNQNFRIDNYLFKMGAYLSKKEKFFVIICGDVLLEVLQFGNRRQLVKLERVGRRLHWIVENFYGGRPFLRLGLNIYPRFQRIRVINKMLIKRLKTTFIYSFHFQGKIGCYYYWKQKGSIFSQFDRPSFSSFQRGQIILHLHLVQWSTINRRKMSFNRKLFTTTRRSFKGLKFGSI